MKKLLILASALALTGCASYKDYSDASVKIAKYSAEEAKENAALAAAAGPMGQGFYLGMLAAKGGAGAQKLAPPSSPVADLLQAASIFVPAIVQGYGIRAQSQLGMRQSDNGAKQAIAAAEYGFKGVESTNSAFMGIAGKIQSAGAVTTTYSSDQANVTSTANPITATYTANPVTTTSTANPVTTTKTANPVTTTANPVTTTTGPVTDTRTYTANPVTTDSHNVTPPAAPAQ